MIDFWRKYSLFVIFVLPWIVNSQRVPACFRETSSKPGIFCTNQDLTGIDNSVYDNISPSITKNTIKRIELINCTIDNLNFLDSDYLQGVTHLYMSSLTGLRNHHLASLVPNVSLSLEQLTITKHPSLTSVDDLVNGNSNSGEWTKLEEFRVGNNGLESVTRELFAKIKSATEYDFSFNALRRLDLSAHKSVLRVKKITLNNNKLDTVDGLGDFTGLEELDLSRNRLTKVDNFATSVVGGGKLSQLDLSDNLIESFKLNGKASDEQGTLFIKLRNNRLTTISDLGSGVARNVYILDLAGNSDLQIGENTFTGLENLKELRLTSCGIPAITTHLQNLPNLSILYLDKNKIAELSRETFKGTKNVEQLWLKENNLQSLEFVSSETVRLNKLVKLDISLNQLSNLENFVAASELEELRMDGSGSTNGFTQLSACGTFTKLPTKLKIVCARDIKPNTEKSCRYHTFLNLLRSSSNKIIFNNNECCDNPTCNVSQSSYPAKQECPDKVKVCSIDIIEPANEPVAGNEGLDHKTTTKNPSIPLYAGIGGLAFVFLVLVIVIIVVLVKKRQISRVEDFRFKKRPTGGSAVGHSAEINILDTNTDVVRTVDYIAQSAVLSNDEDHNYAEIDSVSSLEEQADCEAAVNPVTEYDYVTPSDILTPLTPTPPPTIPPPMIPPPMIPPQNSGSYVTDAYLATNTPNISVVCTTTVLSNVEDHEYADPDALSPLLIRYPEEQTDGEAAVNPVTEYVNVTPSGIITPLTPPPPLIPPPIPPQNSHLYVTDAYLATNTSNIYANNDT